MNYFAFKVKRLENRVDELIEAIRVHQNSKLKEHRDLVDERLYKVLERRKDD